jgi:putative NADH-flavin reductase
MKIAVFGATGGTGVEIVKQALAQGHEVTAFVRDPARMPLHHKQLQLVVGDVLDPEAVADVVAGHEAVTVSLGTGNLGDRSLRARGTAHIIDAMQAHDVSRLVVVSAMGVGDSFRQVPLLFKGVVKSALRNTYADHEQQEAHVRASGLEWVIVRPGQISDSAPAGRYATGPATANLPGKPLAYADLAAFVLEQLEEDRHLGETISITGS